MRIGRSFRPARLGCALVALCAVAALAPASTVEPMNLDTLADLAGQAIVGRVSAVESYWTTDTPRRIESRVTLEQVEYLKGAPADAATTFTLIVPGGRIGDTRMQVCCTPTFAVGDKWVLFLLPQYRTFPVVGLFQGSFVARPDENGVERIHHMRHDRLEPVTGFDDEGFARVAGTSDVHAEQRLVGANGVRLKPTETTTAAPAMALDDFLKQVRPILNRSRAHDLKAPAGRPIREPLQAGPLVPAAGAARASESGTVRGSAAPAQDAPAREPQAAAKGGEAS